MIEKLLLDESASAEDDEEEDDDLFDISSLAADFE
jgi:hypothetical protein